MLPLVIESEIERLVPGGSPERLARIVQQDDSSLGANCARGLATFARAAFGKHRSGGDARAHEMVLLERGLIVLEIITGIAPLLGLIGAVSGLVHVFSHLGLSTGAADTKAIALGIAEALERDGLRSCPSRSRALIAFSYFSKKVEVMSVEMETLVVELISKCYYGRVAPQRMTPRHRQLRPRSPVPIARTHAT